MSEPKFTEKDWDETRTNFASSLMVDTKLSSLAQNLDGPEWPVKAKDETPAKYIDLSYGEAIELLALKGQSADKLDLLITIMRETLAFDNPFGDMVEQTEAASARDNPLVKNMARFGLADDFPIALTALNPDTLEFCRLENLKTLGEFAVFAQGMSQSVIIGGDFRRLLNAIANLDEVTLCELLPYRKGAKGLHLVEAIAQSLRSPNPLAKAREASAWFREEFAQVERDVKEGTGVARHLGVLGNVEVEKQVSELLRQLIRPGYFHGAAAPGTKTSFFKKLFGK